MRLRHLRVSAFGPFAATEEVDFTALADAGLFLIQGPTGAGKTSVLDAVCFALFGTVPGPRRNVRNLRSDHAAPGAEPKVVLEYAIAGRTFRLTRSPEWQRPKQRGTGTTRQQASVIFEEHSAEGWRALSTRIDETAHQVEKTLGMNVAQFSQVALLPQGDFAAFLRAGAEERRKVLEKLFATEIYAAVEKRLAEERARTHREADALLAEFTTTARLVAEVAAVEPPEDAAEDALLEWADELAAGHAVRLRGAEEALEASRAAVQAAQRAAADAVELNRLKGEHAEAVRRRAELDGRAPGIALLRERLAAAERAERVRPYGSALRGRRQDAENAERQAAEARRALSALVPPAPLPCVCAEAECRCGWSAEASAETVGAARRVWQDEIARLDGLRGRELRLSEVTREVAELRERAERQSREEERARQDAERLPALIEADRRALETARIGASQVESARKAGDDAARAVEDARRRDKLKRDLAKAEEAHRAAVDRAQEATDALQTIRGARLAGMAALLAAGLRDGEPCQVCGSAEHPAPAVGAAEVPTDADEERAGAVQESCQRVREEAAGRCEGIRAEYDVLAGLVEGTVEALMDALAAAQDTLRARLADAGRVEELDQRVREGERLLEQAREAQGAAGRAVAEATASVQALTEEAGGLRAELEVARGTDASLNARISRLTSEAALLDAAVAADARTETASRELAQAETAFDAAWREQGFASVEDARQALLPEPERAAATAEVRGFDDAEAAVRARLESPELRAAAVAEDIDADKARTAAAEAEEAHTALVSAHDAARRVSGRLAELAGVLRERHAAWLPAHAAYTTTARLAYLVNGQPPNPMQMRLSAYVLSARLDQVVAAANARLSTMSQSRYLLHRTDERAAGDTKRAGGGLGLRVIDSWTGQERDPATLSGGESFVTSLALALGLADVVTAEAGGAEINTLFIDEGFGTLDEDTLDEVMNVLDSLRGGGRSVGVVSHVAELRTRIPTQLRLTKTRHGSRLSTTP
ncbi:SMC family ATPase [Actinocorallia sp. A-T 12471]|uniref:SMC family ATPase n=1 Tax=Actinocorallia sp. A-T 12471 TaxID=3089813 RepID=UPI0029CE685D|nr:SMC family ATPase [Actinocorallia sp. A-T 12471]MDX6739466.1 SMC family ATPase [Actinocorallia sp. A-T 12471]